MVAETPLHSHKKSSSLSLGRCEEGIAEHFLVMSTTRSTSRKIQIARRVAVFIAVALSICVALLYSFGYRFKAEVVGPEWAGYFMESGTAYYDSVGGGYRDESGYFIKVDRLELSCVRVVAQWQGQTFRGRTRATGSHH